MCKMLLLGSRCGLSVGFNESTPAVAVRVRYIRLARPVIRVKARTRFGVRVSTDVFGLSATRDLFKNEKVDPCSKS